MSRCYVLCLFTVVSLGAIEPSKFQDSISSEEKVEPSIPLARLRGIAILESGSTLSLDKPAQIDSVYIDERTFFLGDPEKLKTRLTALIQGQEITDTLLLAIRKEVLASSYEQGQHAISVEIPEQDITNGIVVCQVSQAKIGKVQYLGNYWFSKQRVEKKLCITPGEPLDECALLNRVAWLNQNPFHYTQIVLAPGQEKGETEIDVITKDRFPLRVYTGGDNTGVESTGRSRFFGGITLGDAFFIDDLLTFQFTSNSSYNKFHNYLLSYTSFLPWEHSLMIYGGYAEIETNSSDFKNSGKEAQASFRYKIPFKPYYTDFQQELYFGFDYKYETSALFFVAELELTGVSNKIVNVTQGMLGYLLEYTPRSHQMTFQIEFFGSPLEMLPHQSSQDYNRLRPHAKPYYFYSTLSLGEIYTFPSKLSIAALLRAQGATGALVPSEQFKLGGYNSVRGYEESVFISDNGIILNFEFRTSPISFLKKRQDQLTFLGFMDYGWGYNYYPFDGIKKTGILWGAGPGLRYHINPYFNFRIDYGFKLHNIKFDDNKLGMWHIGATLSY